MRFWPTFPASRPPRRADGRPVIGVLGNIGQHKGAAVVQALSRDLARNGEAGLVVIGQLDPAYRLARPPWFMAAMNGATFPPCHPLWHFGLADPLGLARNLLVHHPRGHRHRMPVFCFDLGAQADALRASLAQGGPGAILPLAARPPCCSRQCGSPPRPRAFLPDRSCLHEE